MGETPRTREELLNRLANYCSADARDIEIVVKALEAHGLRIVAAQPTREMIEASGYEDLDHIDEAIADAIAASPFAAEAGEDKPEGK